MDPGVSASLRRERCWLGPRWLAEEWTWTVGTGALSWAEPPEGHRGAKGSMRSCGVGLKGVWGTPEACGRVRCGESLCRAPGATPGFSMFEWAPRTGFLSVWGSPGVSSKGGTTAGARGEAAGTAAAGERGSQRRPGAGRPGGAAGQAALPSLGPSWGGSWVSVHGAPGMGPGGPPRGCSRPAAHSPGPDAIPRGSLQARRAPLLGQPQAWHACSSLTASGSSGSPHSHVPGSLSWPRPDSLPPGL